MSEQELAKMAKLVEDGAAIAQGDDVDMVNYEDVVHGRQPVDISHAGGEMHALAAGAAVLPRYQFRSCYFYFHLFLNTDLMSPSLCSKTRRVDHRTRRDRNERRQLGFQFQLEDLTDAYMSWCYRRDHGTGADGLHSQDDADGCMFTQNICVVDTYGMWIRLASLHFRSWPGRNNIFECIVPNHR